MQPGRNQEQGFTLIEVLAAIVILSIVSLVLTSYFTQAMTYSKSNQNKTIMVNLARNALFYMEKQDFDKMEDFFTNHTAVTAAHCPINGCSDAAYIDAFSDVQALANVLNPRVNNVDYVINIIEQPELLADPQPQPSGNPTNQINRAAIRQYLLPVKVEVRRSRNDGQPAYTVVVEGYINDEKIR
jgi:prepilin-type N-terminal cleavage/methylation domain-containing protein